MKNLLQVVACVCLVMAAGVACAAEQCARVYFPFDGDSIISPAQTEALDRLLSTGRKLGGRFVVSGYTDAWATRDYNYRLAARRVEAVVSLMVQAGVAPRNIAVRSVGEQHSYLVATNKGKQDSDMIRNRRVAVCRVR